MSHKLNQALADALGVQLQGTSTVGFTLRARAGRLPTLTVHRHVFDASQIKPITGRFELRPIREPEPGPLDLDAMAEQARRRVGSVIDRSAQRHLSEMRRETLNIRIICEPPENWIRDVIDVLNRESLQC